MNPVPVGEADRLWTEYDTKIRKLEAEIQTLRVEHDTKLAELQAKCGPHIDDGGFMFGTCTHCGLGG